MSWNGFVALGSTAAGVFTESVSTGYARIAFPFGAEANGKMQGMGLPSTFTTTSAVSAVNCLGFFLVISGGTLQLSYPLVAPVQYGLLNPIAFNPYSVVVDLDNGITRDGIPLDIGAAANISGVQAFVANYSNSPALTAHAGGGQALATLIPATVTRVSTVASLNDSVRLPPALAGASCTVVNNSLNAMQVYGFGTDTINGVATATGVSQPPSSVDTYWCPIPGSWFAEVGAGFSGGMFTESSQDNITAFAGGGQGSATLITTQTARVVTVATALDSIKLPVSAAGLELIIINSGANSVQVYGSGTDTIDSVATATGVTQMVSSMCIYTCATAGSWYSNGLGTGYSGSLPTQSFANNITAFGGGGQGSATLLATVLNRVTTVVTAADSVKLPVSAGGLSITVSNGAASGNSLNVFPAAGDQINNSGANVAFAVTAQKTATFFSSVAGTWHSLLSQ